MHERLNCLFLVLCIACVGCAAPRYKVSIESDPPGVKVFYSAGPVEDSARGKEYLGTTPLVWETIGDGQRNFLPPRVGILNDFVQPVVVLTATLPSTNTVSLTRRMVFHGGAIFQPADRIPEKIMFDFTTPEESLPK
ncbi:MAG: hypothetical protein JWN25_3044 [Verrucomicrobiales bacterium]|nr:hypothetical protein [Verrucomicrobiales bacterium]